jgi:hypothetical protein
VADLLSGNATHRPGATWHHVYSTGHVAHVTKVSTIDYLVEVQPPHAARAEFAKVVLSLKVAVTKADDCVGEPSAISDWRPGAA